MTVHAKQKRVLLVEPNRVVRMLLDICIQQKGHLVISRGSYTDALHLLESEFLLCFPPDIIVVAVQSSLRESLLLLSLLLQQASYRNTMVVAMVFQGEERQRDIAYLLRAVHAIVLLKPVAIHTVLSCLKTE